MPLSSARQSQSGPPLVPALSLHSYVTSVRNNLVLSHIVNRLADAFANPVNLGHYTVNRNKHIKMYTVATLPWEIQKSHFSTVLFIHTSDYLRYLRSKQTVTPLPTTPEKCQHITL